MRSIVSLSLLSLGILNTPFNVVAPQPVDSLQLSQISASEYAIVFAQTDEREDKLSYSPDTLKSSLNKAQLASEANHQAYLAEQQRIAEEKAAEEAQRQAEAEAQAREAERQRILAAERAQAERERQAQAAAQALTPPTVIVSGGKQDWLRAAGIPESDWQYADYIVAKESSWNPNAVNPSSGACGLAQALPCSKIGGNWNDPVTALRWQYNYVQARYGGYRGAYEFWLANNWY